MFAVHIHIINTNTTVAHCIIRDATRAVNFEIWRGREDVCVCVPFGGQRTRDVHVPPHLRANCHGYINTYIYISINTRNIYMYINSSM